ncbi:MAG TPA: radical SAM protein [Nitrososphaeraceae archaeon]|nr:radical SAM protein [Nitrososphaeraceae archaeon]
MGSLSLIVKATRLCNLRCTYCHDWRVGPNQTMSFSVMARMIASALRDEEHDAIDFVWHGGEPTLLPISFYEKAILVQSRFRRSGQVVMNTIQTNGTRLTEPWVRFLQDNQFSLGVSLDGPPEIHNKYRTYESGRPSFQDISATLHTLKQYDIPFSVLMVIDEDALEVGPSRIFDFFVKMKIKNYGFVAATPMNTPKASPTLSSHYVDPERMTNFLIKMYECWKEHGDSDIRIRELENILQCVQHGSSHSCTLEGNCFGHYYVVEPNGEVAHCELFQGDSRYTLGNILESNFEVFRNSRELSTLIQENRKELDNLQLHCPEFAVCKGWCPHERYLSVRHNPNHTNKCCGLFDLIRHIRDNMPKWI